ncbi:MAG: hypothetical protein IJZ46_04765 [Bacilli bacterium]|nr:hypothetical protein [Bacilli bacterium]
MKPYCLDNEFFGNDNKMLFINPDNVFYMINPGDMVLVSNGEFVYKDQKIKTDLNGFGCYASVSGFAFIRENYLIINNDFKESSIQNNVVNSSIEKLKKDFVLSKLLEFGIYNNGALLGNEIVKDYKNLIINLNEKFLYSNNKFSIIDNVLDFYNVVDLISREFNYNTFVFVPKRDKSLYDSITSIMGSFPLIRTIFVDEKYPFNQSEFLINKYLKRVSKNDCLFLEADTLVNIISVLKKNAVVQEKYVTLVSKDLGIYTTIKVKYGTSLTEFLKFIIGDNYMSYDYYFNNVLERVKCKNIGFVIIDNDIDTIYISNKNNVINYECIRCGLCNNVCPLKLNPMVSLEGCNKCGLCNNVCPSNINLIHKEENYE